MGKIHISAFGIHSGGGAVLLYEFLCAAIERVGYVFLDSRFALRNLENRIPNLVLVKPVLLHRLTVLHALKKIGSPGDVILCFNGIAPSNNVSGVRVIPYIQAPYLVDLMDTGAFPPITRIRFALEKKLFKRGLASASEIWCQTPSMKRAIQSTIDNVPVAIRPFTNKSTAERFNSADSYNLPKLNKYLYPADASEHKNHARLYSAWNLLYQSGVEPILKVTIPYRYHKILKERYCPSSNNIECIESIEHNKVLKMFENGYSLIFPSLAETYGLPLVEASAFHADIIASELDYVRDVCIPLECFDPNSPISIARAVMRHLHLTPTLLPPLTPAAFVEALVSS